MEAEPARILEVRLLSPGGVSVPAATLGSSGRLTRLAHQHYKRVHGEAAQDVMLTLRIPTALRAELRSAVKFEHRSVNGLVVAMIFKTFPNKKARA